MSQAQGPVERFVGSVRRRLTLHRFWTTAIWAIVAAAAALVVIGLAFTLRGYAVPTAAIVASVVVAVVGGTIAWFIRRPSNDDSARFADGFYRLHDSISSYLHFARQGRSGGYYALQAEQTRSRVEPLKPEAVRYQRPRWAIRLGIALLAVAVPLCLLGTSQAVLDQQFLADQTQQSTELINEHLARVVEELREEAIDEEEEELLKPDELRELVAELRETPDQKEALRQYAELERQLNEARLAVQRQADERLLERVAAELENARETQPLAKELEQKNYDGAAEELAKLEPQQDQSLTEQQKQLARLKAAAQRMAAAARATRSASASAKSSASPQPTPSQSASSSSSSGSNSANGSGQGSSGGGGEMGETMQELADAVAKLDDALSEAQREQSQMGQVSEQQAGECQACQAGVASQLASLSQQLQRMGMLQRTEQRLASLCQACSQCQGGLCNNPSSMLSLVKSLCQSPNAGGLEAGMGSTLSRRSETDTLADNGQTSRLRGIKGEGPSMSTVEAAEEGSGVSTRRATARQRDFEHQFESFVQREDVPEQVKQGVKQYFQVIHQTTAATTSEETPPNDNDGI